MHSFHINSFSMAAIVATLFFCLLGAFVVIPVISIQWLWNSTATQLFALPIIHVWQAGLLYVAGICLLYIFGLIKIEIKSEALDDSSVLASTESLRNYFKGRISAKHKFKKDFFDGDNDPTKKED